MIVAFLTTSDQIQSFQVSLIGISMNSSCDQVAIVSSEHYASHTNIRCKPRCVLLFHKQHFWWAKVQAGNKTICWINQIRDRKHCISCQHININWMPCALKAIFVLLSFGILFYVFMCVCMLISIFMSLFFCCILYWQSCTENEIWFLNRFSCT